MSGFGVRPFEPRDLATVAALEVLCNPKPWSEEALRPFAEGLGASRSSSLVVVTPSDIPVAYVIASRAADEAEILQLGVAPQHRRQGIAAVLLRELFARLQVSGTRMVYLEVRQGNAPARALYGSLGFFETGVRKGYYADGEDGVLLRRLLAEEA